VTLSFLLSTASVRSPLVPSKACRSHEFQGCIADPPSPQEVINFSNTVGQADYEPLLRDVVCPAHALAYGSTCPSALQAYKRLLWHEYSVQLLISPDRLVLHDITDATSANGSALCLHVRRMLGPSAVADAMKCPRRGFEAFSVLNANSAL
jgi:hypothetical protein